MSDVLIRDVPDAVLTAALIPVAVADLREFADTFGDLGDAGVTAGAWD